LDKLDEESENKEKDKSNYIGPTPLARNLRLIKKTFMISSQIFFRMPHPYIMHTDEGRPALANDPALLRYRL
jgi:predicted ATPase